MEPKTDKWVRAVLSEVLKRATEIVPDDPAHPDDARYYSGKEAAYYEVADMLEKALRNHL